MTYPTHKAFAVCWVLLGNIILYNSGITEINYYLSMIVMLHIGKYGALFPDIDHKWEYVKEKTLVNKVINRVIHATGGKHRSWHTHSIDIALLCTFISYKLPSLLLRGGAIDIVNAELLKIIMIGFCLGWLSHLFSDMLTSAGVRIIHVADIKIALVPKMLGKLRFNTGNEWEQFVYSATRVMNIVVGVVAMIYPFIVVG